MMRRLGLALGALFLAGSVAGCTTETLSSSDITTHGIAATIVVTAWNDRESSVEATLRAGGDESNTYIVLDSGDAIYAQVDGEKKAMTAQSAGVYGARFATGAGGSAFKVSLERPNGDNAPDSTGSLPEPFSFVDVPTTAVSRASDSLIIKWDNGGSGSMELEVNGICIFQKTFSIASGSVQFTIKPGDLESTGVKPEDQKSCDIDLTMTREVRGTPDSAYDNESTFKLRQVRRITVPSNP